MGEARGLTASGGEVAIAESAAAAAAKAQSAVAARLEQRTDELAEFDTVEIGARCKRCLQPVSAEHAERERRRRDHGAKGWQRVADTRA